VKKLIVLMILLSAAAAGYWYWTGNDVRELLPERLALLSGANPASDFEQPQPGDWVRLELSSGNVRQGEIREISDRTVTIVNQHGEITYAREQIAAPSRRLLFRADDEGAPEPGRPHMISDPELIEYLRRNPDATDPLGLGPGYQYVIVGTNALFLYRPE